jgi:hypothetical protein
MASDDSAQNTFFYPWLPWSVRHLSGGSRTGEWLRLHLQRSLGTIADSLVYEVAGNRKNSLPSPWSRAMQFEQAVINSSYPTRKELLNELFGCFATVGLSRMFGLTLEAERVDLEDHIDKTDEAVGPFARRLFDFRPSGENALYTLPDGRHPWGVVYVLKVNRVVIGFTSPATVLCPAVQLPTAVPGMRWTADGRFGVPTGFLGAQQRQSLADWLSYLSKEILIAPDLRSHAMSSHMAAAIREFVEDLTGGRIGKSDLSDIYVANLPPRPRAFAALSHLPKDGASPSNATVELGDRWKRPLPLSPDRPVILFDPEMPSCMGLPAREITLYKSATLESVGFDKHVLERLYPGEIEVLTPDDIFLPDLFLLPGESALVNSWLNRRLEGNPILKGSPVTPLLPLQERIREMFSSDELSRICSLRAVTDDKGTEITVTLMIPLRDARDPYPITRTFPIKEQNLINDDLPVIALWPNITDLSWKLFYIFCEDRSAGLSVGGFHDYELRKVREGQEKVKYFTSNRFPDLIKLIDRGHFRGLIPVNPPPPTTNAASSWRVGFDFGTCFTNFFIDDGSGPSRKPLETHVIPLTLAQKENQLYLLYKFFIPETILPKDSNPPSLTALNTYGWQETLGALPQLYHETRVQWLRDASQVLRGRGIRTDLKWHQLQYQQPFIMELALLISSNAAAVGVSELDWSPSYPSAFSRNEMSRYRSLWGNLCTDLSGVTGQRHKFMEDDWDGMVQTEAVAFASYFGNHLKRQMVHTACLDVGGATTDISIWQENTLLHQVSIQFAGRDICTKIMRSKPSFIRYLFPPGITGGIDDNEDKLRQDPNFNCWFDNWLRYVSDELLRERIPILRSEQERQLIEFVSLMAVSMGGIYHYLGLLLRALAKESRLIRLAPVPVYIGGNGARFLNWLDESGSFTRGCDADKLMEVLQCRSSGFGDWRRGSAPTTLSNAFKDETACGLISKGVDLKLDSEPRDGLIVSGEQLLINGIVFETLDRVSMPMDMNRVESYELGSLNELQHFVSNYDEALATASIKTLLPIRKLASLETLLDQVEIEARSFCLERVNKYNFDLRPEPGFVTGLRALSNILARQWAERF